MPSRVPAGVPASITVTLETSGLNVGYDVWDDSGTSPVQVVGLPGMVNGVLPALNFSGSSYRVQIPALQAGKWYLLHIGVYTDGTYTALTPDEPQGDETIFFEPTVGINVIGAQEIVASLEDGDIVGVVSDC